jgi:hypothetical protein
MRDDRDRGGAELVRPAKAASPTVLAYKATADESGGEITVKRVNADGTVTGSEITLKVLP